MKEILEENIKEALQWCKESIISGEKFLKKELPLYCKELIIYEIVVDIITIIIAIFLAFIANKCAYYIDSYQCMWAPTIILFLIAIGMVINGIYSIIKPIAAPRVFLIDKLSELIKRRDIGTGPR